MNSPFNFSSATLSGKTCYKLDCHSGHTWETCDLINVNNLASMVLLTRWMHVWTWQKDQQVISVCCIHCTKSHMPFELFVNENHVLRINWNWTKHLREVWLKIPWRDPLSAQINFASTWRIGMSLLSSYMTLCHHPNVFGTPQHIGPKLQCPSVVQSAELSAEQVAEQHHLWWCVRCSPGQPSSPGVNEFR